MSRFPSVTLPNTEVRTLRSTFIDQEYHIYVGFPYHYVDSPKPLPVLYMLDANIGFSMIENLRMLQHVRELPEFLLVGIAYPVRDFLATLTLRQRDYTPTSENTGGAANFLHFLHEELIPFIERNYQVNANDRGIVGVSLGGLFALYVLFHQPDTFQRYVVISPSLWWGDGLAFAYEEQFAANHMDLKAELFMSAGALEDADIKDNMLRLSQLLSQRNYNGLSQYTQILSGETHVSGVSSAICRGIRALYPISN